MWCACTVYRDTLISCGLFYDVGCFGTAKKSTFGQKYHCTNEEWIKYENNNFTNFSFVILNDSHPVICIIW